MVIVNSAQMYPPLYRKEFPHSVIKLAIDLGWVRFEIKIRDIYFAYYSVARKSDSSGQATRLCQLMRLRILDFSLE
jgi:hypothetical protein